MCNIGTVHHNPCGHTLTTTRRCPYIMINSTDPTTCPFFTVAVGASNTACPPCAAADLRRRQEDERQLLRDMKKRGGNMGGGKGGF